MPKLTDKTELTSLSDSDLAHVVDVSDTTSGASGTSKKITFTNIFAQFLASARTFADNILFPTGKGIKASGSGGFTLQDSSSNVIATIGSGGANLSFNQLINGYLAVNSSGAVTTNIAPNAQTGTTYTLAATDNCKTITFNNASAITVTLPQQSTLTTSAGFWCRIRNLGAGTITFVKEGSETLDGNTTLVQYGECLIGRPTTTKWSVAFATALYPFQIEAARVPSVPVASATYVLVAKAKSPFTITGFTQQATSLGIAGTYTININGLAVTGLSAVTNTTSITETSATAANTVSTGDQVTIVFSGTIATPVGWVGSLSILQTF